MRAAPLILVCYGWHEGIPAMLESLKVYSPETEVHIIGNHVTRQHIKCSNTDNYSGPAERFKAVYEHHSVNGMFYELSCYLRWFVALEYARAKNIERMWILDYDVLVLCNLNDYIMENTTPLGAACQISRVALRVWCAYLQDRFSNKATLKRYIDLYEAKDPNWPVLNDMTFAVDYGRKNGMVDPFQVSSRNEAFDHNIAAGQYGFVLEDGIKRLRFENGYALAWNEAHGTWVRMLTLHCWSYYKKQMAELLKKAMDSKC